MHKLVIIPLLVLTAAFAQQTAAVNSSIGPPPFAAQSLYYYDGSGNLIYKCTAMSDQAKDQRITVSAASNASPVSFTATSHGFDYQSGSTVLPTVTISGGTGNWTAINGNWAATPTSANAFTIAVDSSAFGALTGTLVVTTRSPLTTSLTWAIQKFVYNASSNLIGTFWASNPPGAGPPNPSAGSTGTNKACASRTQYSYQ